VGAAVECREGDGDKGRGKVRSTVLISRKSQPTLRSLSLEELQAVCGDLGEPTYRAKQLFQWLHRRQAEAWEAMTDLPKGLRERMACAYRLQATEPVLEQRSADGTRKVLLRLADGQTVETVGIPAVEPDGERRFTVCVSTQVGCALACAFCATGTMGLLRNLDAGEIVEQVYRFVRRAGDESGRGVTHVVFMGMGEPLHNYEATVRAIRLLNHPLGLRLGVRRITVSTSGLVPEMERLLQEGLDVNLAVSLHAPDDTLRSTLVPLNRRYPIAEVLRAAERYAATTGRRVSFEYIMIDGVNDSLRHARALVSVLPKHRAHVNLIPMNPTHAADFRPSRPERVLAFQREVIRGGVPCTIRAPRGRDIAAACGQLRTEVERRPTRPTGEARIVASSAQATEPRQGERARHDE
jgi:23S rRNA (adenine2503-C2)-methyltransferase